MKLLSRAAVGYYRWLFRGSRWQRGIAVGGTIFVLLVLIGSLTGGEDSRGSEDGASRPPGDQARVVRVIDGDTIEVEMAQAGKAAVRYIGIDTPESVAPGRPVDCFAREASAKNSALVLGKTVYLEKDVSETDSFGRLLRYVYLESGEMVNEVLVREGFATVATYPPDVKYQDRFLAAQGEARAAGRGLWSACGNLEAATATQTTRPQPSPTATRPPEATQPPAAAPATQPPAPTAAPRTPTQPAVTSGGSVRPLNVNDCPPTHPIKGNVNSSGERIYHVPGGQFYSRTNPEECFATPADAERAGYRASRS